MRNIIDHLTPLVPVEFRIFSGVIHTKITRPPIKTLCGQVREFFCFSVDLIDPAIAVTKTDLGHRFLSPSTRTTDDSPTRSLELPKVSQGRRQRMPSHEAVDRCWRAQADSWFSSRQGRKLTLEADAIAEIASARLEDSIV